MPETQAPGALPPKPPSSLAAEAGPDILARILATKRGEVERLRPRRDALRAGAEGAPPARDFAAALASGSAVALVAEVKRRSPGAGSILPGLDPAQLARGYVQAGAAAVSVLTDREYFGGSLQDLADVRDAVSVPVLRKDFVLSEEQVWEARAAGADAILLIVRILTDAELESLGSLAEGLGMTALVEVHAGEELGRALRAGARVIGINNRDLRTFHSHIDTTLDLIAGIPDDVIVVSESGIWNRDEVEKLGGARVSAILVGEALLRADDPEAKVRELSSVPREDARSARNQRKGRR